MSKITVKDFAMSPGAPAPVAEEQRPELLGSLTTLQQQRTSARVIKKLKLEPPADKRDASKPQTIFVDATDCETPNKMDDKDALKFPTVKQRMPKALWSADEKSLFFEALNEYGKDFDAITAYICAKMKKKGMPDANLKTKTQVSHFYYRTWHKLAKHVNFDENVKKVAQELYALINYGELRRKLVSVSEKTCARLGEMVRGGSMAVRARGRTLRVRTPMCRALRRLNQIAERACGARVCSRATVSLRARDAAAWARVQAAAHNPRAAIAAAPRARLAGLLRALQRRWSCAHHPSYKSVSSENGLASEVSNEHAADLPEFPDVRQCDSKDEDAQYNHLGLEPDRWLLQDNHQPKKLALHVGPRPGVEIHLPVLSPSEQLSSQKICFTSYLERMRSKRSSKDEGGVKIRTPKRQRKDSGTDKDKELEPKKLKLEDADPKLMHIDETAIDGIELMANYKSNIEDEEKPSTEDEKEMKAEETAEEEVERDKYMSEREKDSFSEMEDDEKYNKSDTDNESDWKGDKTLQERKFKNLKVKFRIRPKKCGGSVYTLVLQSKIEDSKVDGQKVEEETKPDIDVETAVKQIRKGWSLSDAGDLTIGDLYLMFGSRSKLELDYWWAEPTPPLPQPLQKTLKIEIEKPLEKDRAIDRREKANRTPDKGADSSVEDEREKRESDTDIFSPKNTFSQDSNDGMSGDERKSEQLASPDHKSSGTLKLVDKLINRPTAPPAPNGFSQLSDRLKRLLALAGNPHVGAAGAPRCACGHVCAPKKGHAHHDKKPLGVAGGVGAVGERGRVFRPPQPIAPRPRATPLETGQLAMSLEALPRRRPGRPRLCERRVVVQRLLPLLPKLPPPAHTHHHTLHALHHAAPHAAHHAAHHAHAAANNLIPVKIMPKSSPTPPRILLKPPSTSTSDMSCVYVLSESNGQFYFHDGDRRIPISPYGNPMGDDGDQDDLRDDDDYDVKDVKDVKLDISATEVSCPRGELKPEVGSEAAPIDPKSEQQSDMTGFLPSESLSLSPSRLLRDAEGWLAGTHDFSLSSFLHTLDARHERGPVNHEPADHAGHNDQPDHSVDSQLQSLMAESSMDYVAKFADLAAEVTDTDPLAD